VALLTRLPWNFGCCPLRMSLWYGYERYF
jgi:hypothetical protein